MGCAVLLLVFAFGGPAAAQGVASSFDQLSVLVAAGDRITVEDVAGKRLNGRIGTLSGGRLTLVTRAGTRELGEADVVQIRQRRDDSLLNGAIVGAAAGTAYFVTLMAVLWDRDGGGVIVPTAIAGGLMMAGMGAAAGVGIDALITGRQVIYRRPPSAGRVTVSPLMGNGRRGAAIAVKF